MVGNAMVEGLAGARAGVHVSRRARLSHLRSVRTRGFARDNVRLSGGAVVGALVFGLMLVGCSDKPAPSEAAVEQEATTYNHQEIIASAIRSGRIPLLVFDDCDPSDPAWNEVGGCTQAGGLVDFNAFLAALPQGHPAWQNLPSYLRVNVRRLRINAVNRGGREHTFTRVAEFGGGVVPILNAPGQEAVPECADPEAFGSSLLPPGARLSVEVQHGTHRYQCCIHPWMRTELRLH